MKNLVLSENTIPTPEDNGKYVNYAKTEDKVNYFGPASESGGGSTVNPVIPEIPDSNKPALSDIPAGVTIAINNGGNINFVPASNYVVSVNTPVIGLGIKDGENAFIMGVDAGQNLKWDNSTTPPDISALPNFPDSAKAFLDFSSKENTDKIVSALPTQSEAALYCRNYEAGGIGVNKWDLPAAGILNVIVAKKADIITALNVLGKPTNWASDYVWSSTEYSSNNSWYYSFFNNGWTYNRKDYDRFVLPIYELYHQETDLISMLQDVSEMPSGVSIVNTSGQYIPVANWNTGDDWTGLALNTGKWKGIIGVAKTSSNTEADDLSISTPKAWSKASLKGTDVPNLTNYTSDAIKDYKSKENTDAILAALASSSNPQETNNAAVVCRNYSKGVLGKGKWDLPTAGILQFIVDNKADIITALNKMGASASPFSFSVWSSTEYNSDSSWDYNFIASSWYYGGKDGSSFVLPTHELFLQTEVKPEDVILPDGVCIVDGAGNVITNASEWSADKGLTGIGVSDGTHKFIMGVADSIVNENKDDLSINSRKYWSNALYGTDVPNVLTTTSESTAKTDYKSKENTDAILAALASSSNPQETNNAAVVCRNYEAGIGKKGQWDLPAAGILNVIVAKKSAIVTALNAIGKPSSIFSSYYVWSSTEYSSNGSWGYYFDNSCWINGYKSSNYFVLPVLTIS